MAPDADLEIGPPSEFTDAPVRQAVIAPSHRKMCAFLRHELIEEDDEPSRLRGELVE